jgi:hypothetical protein
MIISLFMEPTPLSGGRGTCLAAGPHDQQKGQQARELRPDEGQEHAHHVSETA